MTEALIAALDWMDSVNWCDEPHEHMANSLPGRCEVCYQVRAVQRREAQAQRPTKAHRGQSTEPKTERMW
jgi:hypothetical protein